MSNNRNLGNIATAITNATSGQVLTSQGSGVATFADAGGTGVTVHNNQAAMLTDAVSADEGSLHYETANNKLYVKQSSGFFLLASITNTAPTVSGFTETTGSGSATTIADNGTFVLTSGSNTVITLTATDPDLETLVYSATVTSGTASNVISSPSLPISNQSGNTFTLTPVTSGAGGTVTIRFDVSDGNNVVNKTHSFSITFTVVDSNHTTLLATATGTSDNNNITDSSSTNNSISVNGDAYAGTFSPYRSGGYSTYFDGTTDYITIPAASNLDVSLSDTTIEGWFYTTSTSVKQCLWEFYSDDNNYVRLFFEGGSGNKLWLSSNSSGTERLSVRSSATLSINTWYHIAVTRTHSSGAWETYINGSVDSGASGTESASVSTATWPFEIGRDRVSTDRYWNGYISDFRVVKGTAITPPSGGPTERLEAVTNTSLLTCHLPYIADGSTNDHAITVNGDVSTKPFSPYDYKEYSTTDHGGSVYFDGTGDYLTAASDASFDFGTGNFTIETWINIPDVTSTWLAIISRAYSATGGWRLYKSSGNSDLRFYYTGNTYINATSTGLTNNTWHHIAVVRSSGTITIYVDGASKGSGSDGSTSLNPGTYAVEIGSGVYQSSYPMTGYLSDLRIVNGTAVYTGGFTPPSGPLTTTGGTYASTTNVNTSITASNTSLLIKGTDASIIDKSQGTNLKLIGTTTGSTDQVRTGNWANTKTMKFDGNSDYITILNDEAYGFGTGDWTIETWLYCTKTGGFNAIFDTRVGTGTQTGNFGIGMYTTGRVQLFSGGIFYYPTDTLSFNTWQHLAVVKNSGTTTMYFNGTAASTTYSDSRDYGSSQPVQIGKDDTTSNYFGGYMQDFRITKGLARYTASDETSNIPSAPLEG